MRLSFKDHLKKIKNSPLKTEIARFLKFFLLLYLFVFLVIYFKIPGRLSTLKPKLVLEQKISQTELEEQEFFDKPDSIEIPKIAVQAPIVFIENTDFESGLKKGVVHYPDSSLPGEPGTTIILGHSAPSLWPKSDYQGIFSRLNELEIGDEIFVYFEQRQYIYQVTDKFFLEKGQDVPQPLTNSENMVSLISCWPVGVDRQRIAIQATAIK